MPFNKINIKEIMNEKMKDDEFCEHLNDLKLLYIARQRVKNANPDAYINFDDLLRKEGLTHEDLDAVDVDIDIE